MVLKKLLRSFIMDISKIDKNFAVDTEIDKTGLEFYSVDEKPFRLYGVMREGDKYIRLPSEVAKTVSPGVASLAYHTAGGRVRFVTNSKRIAIIAKFAEASQSIHMPFTNKAGVDIYFGDKFVGTFMPPVSLPNKAYESLKDFGEGEKTVTLNFPLYGALSELYVGIDEDAVVSEAPDYKYETPVVFYGSSITQGGCASRPGMAYQAQLTRWLDCNHINLGFSGNAKGEPTMVEYLAGLDMSVFVCDYDHNAPNVEHLKATHEPLYRGIRAKHPNLPIIFISRPSVLDAADRKARLEVIKATYDKAVSEGDENVWLIDGSTFFPFGSNEHTVDNCHPTDLGFYLMAKGIEPVLREALGKVKI